MPRQQMYAEFTIHHAGPNRLGRNLMNRLQKSFGPHDANVLGQTTAGQNLGSVIELYATQTRLARLLFYAPTNDQLQIIVEPLAANTRQASQDTWRTIRRASKWWHRARLDSLSVIDSETGDTFARGKTGLRSAIARTDLWPGLLVALFTAGWLVFSLLTFARDDVYATVLGAIPAIVTGGLALVALSTLRTRLLWEVEGWT